MTLFVLHQNFYSFHIAQVRGRVRFRKHGSVLEVIGFSRTHPDPKFLRLKAPQESQNQTEAAFRKGVDVSHKFEVRMEVTFLANVFSPSLSTPGLLQILMLGPSQSAMPFREVASAVWPAGLLWGERGTHVLLPSFCISFW